MRRKGLGGFVGGSIHWIKGFFSPEYSVTTETVITQGPGFGAGSIITNSGIGKVSSISADGVGKIGLIVLGFGVGSVIRNNGVGKEGLINNDGVGEEGEI